MRPTPRAARALLATALSLALLATGCSGGSDGDADPSPGGTTSAAPAVLGPTPAPEITGEARNGEPLTGHAGTWGPGPVTLSWRWLRDGSPINGAVERTYELTTADVDHRISVQVTGTKPGFPSVDQTSQAVGPVQRAVLRSADPVVDGDPVFGQRVGVQPLDWGSDEVRFRYQWLRDGVPVAGATRPTYRIGLDDLDRQISVEVTGRLAGFDPAVERSAPAGPARTAPFVTTTKPRLTGTPRYYEFLTVPDPGWKPRPTAMSYQWFRDGTAMRGVTGTSYQLHGRDIDHRITVRVTGTRDGFTPVQQLTVPRGPVKEGVLDPSPAPVIVGTPEVDRYLSTTIASWGPSPVSLSWQWYRGKDPIAGATDTSYRLTVEDLGRPISVRTVGRATYFQDRTRAATATAKVQPGLLTRTPTPLYSGVAQVGRTITALPKEWGPGEVRLGYQWFRGKDAIKGATKAQYVVKPDDEGRRLRVRVTGTRHGYRPASEMSGWTGVIAPGTLTPGLPTIDGFAIVFQTLTVDGGDWGPGAVDLAFAWFSDGVEIPGATEASLTLTDAEVGHTISVRVTGSKGGYTSAEAWSAPTGVVLPRER
ncbi:MAG: hypothetical protein U0R80_17680 [Nocardioidaceae bacterium]